LIDGLVAALVVQLPFFWVCLSASHLSWRSGAPPPPWPGSSLVRRAPPGRRQCPRRTWDISVYSFGVIIADVHVFVTLAFGACRVLA
jgi:hypothetical protein